MEIHYDDKSAVNNNREILTRITQSAEFKPLSPADITSYIHTQLDRCGLPHNIFTEAALNLINKVCEGNLRSAKNLCVSGMVEAIRCQQKTVDHEQINRVLDQPHWRGSNQLEGIEPVVFTNQRPDYRDKNLN